MEARILNRLFLGGRILGPGWWQWRWWEVIGFKICFKVTTKRIWCPQRRVNLCMVVLKKKKKAENPVILYPSPWSISPLLESTWSCDYFWSTEWCLVTSEARSYQFRSVVQLCPTLCYSMDCSKPGFPVHHQLLESFQTHVHWVGDDAIQSSHPLSSPYSPALNLSQHQGLFQWVNSSHPVAKVLEFQLQHWSFQWTPRTDLL